MQHHGKVENTIVAALFMKALHKIVAINQKDCQETDDV